MVEVKGAWWIAVAYIHSSAWATGRCSSFKKNQRDTCQTDLAKKSVLVEVRCCVLSQMVSIPLGEGKI